MILRGVIAALVLVGALVLQVSGRGDGSMADDAPDASRPSSFSSAGQSTTSMPAPTCVDTGPAATAIASTPSRAQASPATAATPPTVPMASQQGGVPVLRGRSTSTSRPPFGARYGIGAWTGKRVIVVNGQDGRTATYDPLTDRWRERSRAPIDFDLWQGFWTGKELIAIGDGYDGSGIRGLRYDPRSDTWRDLPELPFRTRYVDAVWADGGLVVLGRRDVDGDGLWVGQDGAARYDLASDCWTELSLPPITVATEYTSVDLYVAGERVVAIAGSSPDPAPLAMSILDPDTLTWSAARETPPLSARERGIWVGDELWFLGVDDDQQGRGGAVWDAMTDTWTTVRTGCPIRSGSSVAVGSLVLSLWTGYALDSSTAQCYRMRGDIRDGAVSLSTGDSLFTWSGSPGEDVRGPRAASLYRPDLRQGGP